MDKKHAKQLARRKKLAQRAEHRATDIYPKFLFVENGAPPEFVRLVRAAVRHIDFHDRSQFTDVEDAAYQGLRAGRPWPVFMQRVAGGGVREFTDLNVHLATNLGEQVFRHIPAADLAPFIPYHEVKFLSRDRGVFVYFQSLGRAKGAGGTVYYSPSRPTVRWEGRELVVGFSRHAIERACERVLAEPLTYTSLGDAFAVFGQLLDYEPLVLPRGEAGFTFWEVCRTGFWERAVAEVVLGPRYDPAAAYSCRVGYCPAVVDAGFLKAKTFLYPGWEGTPEYELLRAPRFPREQRRRWLDLLTGMARPLYLAEAPPLLKWFHDLGIPQVRSGEPRFAPYADVTKLARPRSPAG